jgi:hypothetical protein
MTDQGAVKAQDPPMPATPATDARVPARTAPSVNARIRAETLEHLRAFVGKPDEAIDARLAQLRREWDVERTLEANAAAVALAGTVLGFTRDRRFLALPALVGGFLLQHAVQGWCPPLPVFRRLGVRTSAEIHREMLALRLLRGDFGAAPATAEEALAVAEDQAPSRTH